MVFIPTMHLKGTHAAMKSASAAIDAAMLEVHEDTLANRQRIFELCAEHARRVEAFASASRPFVRVTLL